MAIQTILRGARMLLAFLLLTGWGCSDDVDYEKIPPSLETYRGLRYQALIDNISWWSTKNAQLTVGVERTPIHIECTLDPYIRILNADKEVVKSLLLSRQTNGSYRAKFSSIIEPSGPQEVKAYLYWDAYPTLRFEMTFLAKDGDKIKIKAEDLEPYHF